LLKKGPGISPEASAKTTAGTAGESMVSLAFGLLAGVRVTSVVCSVVRRDFGIAFDSDGGNVIPRAVRRVVPVTLAAIRLALVVRFLGSRSHFSPW
jgi:hypothetical protein